MVDVVIPSASSPAVVSATLQALWAAAAAAPGLVTSITVVDDSGGLGGAAFAEDVDLIATGGGLGSGGARNLGAARGAAPWLMFLDDDITLDVTAFRALEAHLGDPSISAIVGQLRPPDEAPGWVWSAHRDGTLTPIPLGGDDGPVPPHRFACALSLVRREAFERAGGFPLLRTWGLVDAIFGLRLEQAIRPKACLVWAASGFAGVHRYVPTWEEWLGRRERAGGRYATLEREQPVEANVILDHAQLSGGIRAWPKKLAGQLPPRVLRSARGRWPRRLAAAGAEARGYRLQQRAERAS